MSNHSVQFRQGRLHNDANEQVRLSFIAPNVKKHKHGIEEMKLTEAQAQNPVPITVRTCKEGTVDYSLYSLTPHNTFELEIPNVQISRLEIFQAAPDLCCRIPGQAGPDNKTSCPYISE